jgi:hypothetical protein
VENGKTHKKHLVENGKTRKNIWWKTANIFFSPKIQMIFLLPTGTNSLRLSQKARGGI